MSSTGGSGGITCDTHYYFNESARVCVECPNGSDSTAPATAAAGYSIDSCCRPGFGWHHRLHTCIELMSSRLVSYGALSGGLNNQLLGFGELVQIASDTNATLCWPLVNLEFNTNNWRTFDGLFDMNATRECVYREFGVKMASRNPNDEDYRVCQWMISRSNGNDDGISTLYDTNGLTYHNISPPSLLHVTSAELISSIQPWTFWPPDLIPQTNQVYIDHYNKGKRIMDLASPLLIWLFREFRDEVPIHEDNIPLISRGCFHPTNRLKDIGYQIVDGIKRAAASLTTNYNTTNTTNNTTTNSSTSTSASPSTSIGLHLRMESDLPCASSTDWIVKRMCLPSELSLPCNTSVCYIATGLLPSAYLSTVMSPPYGCLLAITKWDLINATDVTHLLREEAAVVDLIPMMHTDYFMGCARSTYTNAAWALRLAAAAGNASITNNLAYNMHGLDRHRVGDPRCYPGNVRWIEQQHLSVDCAD